MLLVLEGLKNTLDLDTKLYSNLSNKMAKSLKQPRWEKALHITAAIVAVVVGIVQIRDRFFSPIVSFSEPIGWIRIGAVHPTNGILQVGNQLTSTETQPTTIQPAVIPKVGDIVRTTTEVNYRKGYPQAPTYKLASKQGKFVKGQDLKILQLESFVDTTMDASYTVVWAEVEIP